MDHRMGYGPAAREDFGAPEAWDYVNRWPLGVPARAGRDWNECDGTAPCGPVVPVVTAASSQCMTRGDLCGLEALEQPAPAPGEPDEPEVLVMVGRGCGEPVAALPAAEWMRPVYTEARLGGMVREPRTLSDAAMWPFASQGWRNEPQAFEASHAGAYERQRRLEKLKAAEHERWLAQQEQRKRDAITQCYTDKARP